MDHARGPGVGGNLLSREVEGFASPKHGCFKIRASSGEDFFMAWEVQGVTAQFSFTNVLDFRELRLCTARAINSLPVPVSP